MSSFILMVFYALCFGMVSSMPFFNTANPYTMICDKSWAWDENLGRKLSLHWFIMILFWWVDGSPNQRNVIFWWGYSSDVWGTVCNGKTYDDCKVQGSGKWAGVLDKEHILNREALWTELGVYPISLSQIDALCLMRANNAFERRDGD